MSLYTDARVTMATSEATTEGIRVHVTAEYSQEHSRPKQGHWFFVYKILIQNRGTQTVQLLTRHWVITNAKGEVEEVRGPGVVGAQPVLAPGESFEYTSACPLDTAFGTMHGSYQMVREDGSGFDAEVAPFRLSTPYSVN